jgi:hypothetical protein
MGEMPHLPEEQYKADLEILDQYQRYSADRQSFLEAS